MKARQPFPKNFAHHHIHRHGFPRERIRCSSHNASGVWKTRLLKKSLWPALKPTV